MGSGRKTHERKTQRNTAYRTVEKEGMTMGYCSWVEAGLAVTDRVSWKSKIFRTEK